MRRILIYSAIVVAFFVAGILMANFLIMPLLVGRGEEVIVPNVCNVHLDSAIVELKNVGLEGVVVERRFDRIIEEGNVIIQEPLPDARAKKGRIVNLTVSLGAETISVPYLSGISYEQGLSIIRRIGLVVTRVDSVFSDSIEPGKIIGTVPEAETAVKKGDGLILILSKGLIRRMPNVVGQQLSQAQLILERMGLVIGTIEEVQGSGRKGTVILQNPEPGRIVNVGDTATVMVIK
ncbi:MAG: PASTA domain-containing protein [candidate division WOR-3 bacterium]|nr:MAG: PASTA domain-containing protein [candidate division WOR-3 bacterium]